MNSTFYEFISYFMNWKSEFQVLDLQTIIQKNGICKYLTKKYGCYIGMTTLQISVVCLYENYAV